MSVIAKLYVDTVTDFGTGTYIKLSCIAENDLMAAYATSEEDKLFSKYSPWGEMRLNQRAAFSVFTKSEEHVQPPGGARPMFYAMLVSKAEVGDKAKFPTAAAYIPVTCYSKTKFAGDGSRVELRESYSYKAPAEVDWRDRGQVIEKISWKMQVDNPPAEAGFVPGQDYWLVFYDASKFDRDQAISAALAPEVSNG
jgi:hypothetical protein